MFGIPTNLSLDIDSIIGFEVVNDASNGVILHLVFVCNLEVRHAVYHTLVNDIYSPCITDEFLIAERLPVPIFINNLVVV